MIHLIQTNNKTNVIANPQILALDNSEATFKSTDKIPVPKVSVAGNGISQTGIDTQPVELSLKLKPSINKLSNFVKMDIEVNQEASFRSSFRRQWNRWQLPQQDRTAKNDSCRGRFGHGGHRRSHQRQGREERIEIPVLGDIPILGWLFKSTSTQSTKPICSCFDSEDHSPV